MNIPLEAVFGMSVTAWFTVTVLYLIGVLCWRYVTEENKYEGIPFGLFTVTIERYKPDLGDLIIAIFISILAVGMFGALLFGSLVVVCVSAPAIPIAIIAVMVTLYTARGIVRLKKDLNSHKEDKNAHKY